MGEYFFTHKEYGVYTYGVPCRMAGQSYMYARALYFVR